MVGMVRRVGLAEVLDHSVHRGENDQHIRQQQRSDEGGEGVVVAELQFGERHRVILVDDGHYAVPQQGQQGVARVEVPVVMLQIIMRQQYLGHVQVEAGEEFFVHGHETRLPYRRARLQLGEFSSAVSRNRARPCPRPRLRN